jgi:superfamily II DNA or RNA helicase
VIRVPPAASLPPAYPDRAAWGTAQALRAWQRRALEQYLAEQPRDFLTAATPGAGKTTFALKVASELLRQRVITAVTVVTPTEHLKGQWADAAAKVGISLDPAFVNAHGALAADFLGAVVTYAQVAAHPVLHRSRTERNRTLVILDEVHHAGDALSWGDAVREAFGPATRRLALTGTPFRSDINPIPFVTYAPGSDGVPRSVADFGYGYGEALRDGVVRPVMFLAYSGQMRWRTRAGDELTATLGEPLTAEQTGQAWRTALDPTGNWIPQVLTAADRRLTEVRRGMPDAGGLVVATDHADARAYARLLRGITGRGPVVVLSDDRGASGRIAEFAGSEDRWMVAVRMVSEGVDVPRLAVGVYATSTATPLYFAQAVGRFLRARRRGETASVFLPTVPVLLGHAGEMEVERDHVLGRPVGEDNNPEADLLAQERADNATTPADVGGPAFESLGAEATFDRVLFDGGEFGTSTPAGSVEEEEYLGLPGLLDADQVAVVLRARQADQLASRSRTVSTAVAGTNPEAPVAAHRVRAALRTELNGLVGAWHHRTGQSHGAIHAELRQVCGGPAVATADVTQLRRRVDTVRSWASGRRPTE